MKKLQFIIMMILFMLIHYKIYKLLLKKGSEIDIGSGKDLNNWSN